MSLYDSTGGPQGAWTQDKHWGTSVDCWQWHGVNCTDSSVFILELSANGLSGSVPVDFFTRLEAEFPRGRSGTALDLTVSLFKNYALGGRLPPLFANMTRVSLFVDSTSVSGTLPEDLGPNMLWTHLFVYNTLLGGTLPHGIGWMRHSRLILDTSEISGSLPASVGDLESAWLIVPSTKISGVVPKSVGSMTSAHLQADYTRISGDLPPSVGDLKESILSMVATGITGELPDYWDMVNSTLSLSYTRVSGEFPSAHTHGLVGSTIDLRLTAVSGTLPENTHLIGTKLLLTDSAITGTLPRIITTTGDAEIDVRNTLISGSVPLEVRAVEAHSIFTLQAAGAQLSGTLPASLGGEGSPLFELLFPSVNISGVIPPELAPRVRQLDLSRTAVSGEVPPTFEAANFLDLSGTRVYGSVPVILGGAQSFVDFGSSPLSGQLPSALLDGRLARLFMTKSGLTGEIVVPFVRPEDSHNLVTIALELNRLSSEIPESLCQHRALSVLSLGFNAGIHGSVPACLGQSLRLLDLYLTNISYVPPEILSSPWLEQIVLSDTNVLVTEEFCSALKLGSVHTLDLSGTRLRPRTTLSDMSECLFEGTNLIQLRMSNVYLTANPEYARKFNFLHASESLQTLIMSNANLYEVKFDRHMTLQETHFPSLQYVDWSYNVNLTGELPRMFANLRELHIHYTQFDVCTAQHVFTSTKLQRLSIYGLSAKFSHCRYLVDNEYIHSDSAHKVTDVFRNNLQCPQWLLGVSNGFINADSTFLGFLDCECPDGSYFGQRRDHGILRAYLSWDDFRASAVLLDAEEFKCWECPMGGKLGCDATTDPRVEHAPQHQIDGNLYPLYSKATVGSKFDPYDDSMGVNNRGNFVFLPERWRLPYVALLLTCQHPAICNVPFPDDPKRLTCRDGHDTTSLLCSRCMEGFFRTGLLCYECFAGAKAVVPIALLLALLAYVLFAAYKNFHVPGIEVASLFLWFQLSSILIRIDEQLQAQANRQQGSEHDTSTLQHGLNTLASFQPFAIECVDRNADFTAQSIALLLGPIILGAFVALLFVSVNFVREKRRMYHEQRSRSEMEERLLRESVANPDDIPMSTSSSWQGCFDVWRLVALWGEQPRWGTALMFTWSVMFFPVLTRAFEVFVCDDSGEAVHGGRVQWLRAAPWIECHSSVHHNLLVLACTSLAVFVMPITWFMWWQLRRHHRIISLTRVFLARAHGGQVGDEAVELEEVGSFPTQFSFLEMEQDDDITSILSTDTISAAEAEAAYSQRDHSMLFATCSIRDKFWYWPLVQQSRSVVLAVAVSFVDFDSVSMPLSVFGLLLASLLAHIIAKPYRRRIDNLLETMVLLAALVRYMLSMLAGLQTLKKSDVPHAAAVLSAFVYVFIFGVLVDPWVKWRKRCRRCVRDSSHATGISLE